MSEIQILQSFAVNSKGVIVSIRDVQRGKYCDCCCPCCGEVMIARQGDIRSWHFAHESGADCSGGAESALHHAAKQLIIETKELVVPAIEVSIQHQHPDGRLGQGIAVRPSVLWKLENPQPELSFGDVRPDVTAMVNGHPVLIEIAVTHFSSNEKRETLSRLGIPCIEVAIDPLENEEWLYHPAAKDLKKKALQNAVADAFRQKKKTYTGVVLHQYKLFGVPVRVTERHWGVTLWNAYDETVNCITKEISKSLGGRWHPKFKNWVMAVGVTPVLIDSLEKAGVENTD